MKLTIVSAPFTFLFLKLINVVLIPVQSRYGRAEVLAGFVNGLFLVFIAFFILSEAVEVNISNPLHLPINMYILYSVLYTFSKVVMRRICSII